MIVRIKAMSENRRILHLIKTLDGATWAFHQILELRRLGWDVHIAAPTNVGRFLSDMQKTGAPLHVLPVEFPVKTPWLLPRHSAGLKNLVQELNPALIHSHFVSTTLLARHALRGMNIPRIFQVPGPLHLEHRLFGMWDTLTADADDYWIGSSEFIRRLYIEKYHRSPLRVFKSYYGIELNPPSHETFLRQRFGIPENAFVIGNVSFFYPPKKHLGQKVGIKGHELMLDALETLMPEHPDLWAVFIGGPWGRSEKYFERLKARAQLIGKGRIIFTGTLPHAEVLRSWREMDLALHIPLSENCGGVVEPLLVKTPVLASKVGGLPEVIIDEETGLLVDRTPESVAQKLRWMLAHRDELSRFGATGFERINQMFARKNTAQEIDALYHKILSV